MRGKREPWAFWLVQDGSAGVPRSALPSQPLGRRRAPLNLSRRARFSLCALLLSSACHSDGSLASDLSWVIGGVDSGSRDLALSGVS